MLRTILSAGRHSFRNAVPRYVPVRAFRGMEVKPLDFAAGPLVWIDCEMTGLDPRKDKILEIAVRNSYVPSTEHHSTVYRC